MLGPQYSSRLSPTRGYTPPPEANIESYTQVAETLGIDRMVIVQPVAYGQDHTCTCDTIEIFGRNRARAVAVLDRNFDPGKLRELDKVGFCGARVNAITLNSTGLDQLDDVVRLIEPLGWHVQLFVHGEQLPGLKQKIDELPMPVVIDHMGQIPTSRGSDSPEFQTLLRLLDTGKVWVKMCGYRSSMEGPPYADLLKPAQKIIAAAPDRCVWGSDWPHTNMFGPLLPNDATLLNLLYDWTPDEQQQHKILVDNPATLYGFQAATAS
jgi:predicted TIM-barrel fold metal-dependent hydrolase